MNTKGEKHVDFGSTRISKNGPWRGECSSLVFWNQGNTECYIDNNIRLAASKINTATGKLEGGEAYVVEDPTGRMLIHTFQVTFTDGSAPSGQTPYNNLTVQWLLHLDPSAGL